MAETDIMSEHEELEVGEKPPMVQSTTQDRDLVRWIQKEKNAAKTHVDKFRDQAREAYRFNSGKQLSDADIAKLRSDHRPTNAFNSAQKFIRFVTGIERYAPEALIFSPVDESNDKQQEFGEFATRCYDWAIAKSYGDYKRSNSFQDLVLTGMGFSDVYIDRNHDSKGLIGLDRISPLEMWWPQTDRQNLEHSRWLAHECLMDKEEAFDRWPDAESLIQSALSDGDRTRPSVDNVIQYVVPYIETVPIDKQNAKTPTHNKVSILEWQWFDEERGWYFYDPLENEDTWMDKKTFSVYSRKLKNIMQKTIDDKVLQSKRVFRKVFLLNSKYQLEDAMELPSNRFSFNCMTGNYDEEDKIFYGFFRVLIDPQKYANKFFNQIIEIMGTQAKGGFLFEEGAVSPKQVDDINDTFSQPGRWNEVNPLAISGGKLMPKPLPQLPASTIEIVNWCTQAMDSVTGLSPDNFGGGTQNLPGVTLRQRQKSGLVLLATEFDALSRFRIEEGRIIFDHLKLLADDRLIRVGGPFDGNVIKLLREPFSLEYELNLDDTERDPNIRRQYTEWVIGIAPTLIRTNNFIPELLDYTPLPVKIRQKLKQGMIQKAQADAQQAQQGIPRPGSRSASVSPQERQSKIDKTKADTMLQIARVERVKGQQKRDELRTIIEAVSKLHQAQIDTEEHKRAGEQHRLEKAAKALDLYNQATNRDHTNAIIQNKMKPQPRAATPK